MKKCRECNVEMAGAILYGYPRWIDMGHEIDRFTLKVKTGKRHEKNF